MKKFLILLKTNAIVKHSMVAIFIAETLIVLFILIPIGETREPILRFDSKIGLAIFTGIPLFLITVIQLQYNSSLQRANFIREFATRLHNERELSESFYYLVYTYSNDIYDEFKSADVNKRKEMQKNRLDGMRLYDPESFQNSEEERRLDALLGFFNVLGYHHHRGVIHIQDIAGVMGFHLAALSTRKAIVAYREVIPAYWKESSFTNEFESVAPYRYLDILLKSFKDFSTLHEKEIKELNQRKL